MNIRIALTAGACLLGLAAMPASAATLVVSNGILTGATGVMVGGVSYDVAFLDGTCASVFGGCTVDNFTFKTSASATLAAQALLDQVFLDTSLGMFDSNPSLTNGCSDRTSCNSLTPFGTISSRQSNTVQYSAASNDALTDSTSSNFVRDTFYDSSFLSNENFARFTLSPVMPAATGAVPEPATWAMMMLGFGGMGYAMRRKTKVGARIRFA